MDLFYQREFYYEAKFEYKFVNVKNNEYFNSNLFCS